MRVIRSAIKIKQSLQNGEMCILPTDTIPGIFADATNPVAIQNIFTVKKRNTLKPLAIFLPSVCEIAKYGVETAESISFCKTNLPGAYTILLKATNYALSTLSPLLISAKNTIGIRIPNDLNILEITKTVIIAGTSVNTSGQPFALLPREVPLEISQSTQYFFISDGIKPSGQPSTILDFSGYNVNVVR